MLAVGYFTRLDGLVGDDITQTDTSEAHAVYVPTNEDPIWSHDPGEGWPWMFPTPWTQNSTDDMIVQHGDIAVASVPHAQAIGSSQSLGMTLTPIGNGVTAPSVTLSATQQAERSRDVASANATAYAASESIAYTPFEFVAPAGQEGNPFWVTGAIFLTAGGIGTDIGDGFASFGTDVSRLGGSSGIGINIWLGDEIIAFAFISGGGGASSGNTGPTSWDISAGALTQNGWVYFSAIDSPTAEVFIPFTTVIFDGQVITFDADPNTNPLDMADDGGLGGYAKAGYGENSYQFELSETQGFQILTAWASAEPFRPLPWPGGGGGGGGGGGLPGAPGDINGDGEIDEEDLRLWAELLADYANRGLTPLIVTVEDDVNNADYSLDDLSLREALSLAASTPYTGQDTIVFAPWVNEIVLDNSAELVVNSDVKIIGHGLGSLTIDGDDASRVVKVNSGVTATTRGMTITGGAVASQGAGVLANGNVILDQVRITDNNATGGAAGGGGVWGTASLTISRSTIDDNDSANVGGGVGISTGGTLTLSKSTVDNNRAWFGGGVFVDVGAANDLSIDSSTISNNDALSSGAVAGGILVQKNFVGTTTFSGSITNSTISGNDAPSTGGIRVSYGATVDFANTTIAYNKGDTGGGLRNNSSTVTTNNTIIAENKNAAGSSDNDVSANVSLTGSYNLLGRGGVGGLNNTSPNTGNIFLTSTSALLAPLGDYGGRTKTHALLNSSPAIDKGLNSLAGTADQRGAERPVDLPGVTNGGTAVYADIGSFEAGAKTFLTVREASDRNTSPAPPDDLSLREALSLSASLAGSETIVFDSSLYADEPLRITLTYDGGDPGSAPDELSINADVTILGPGASDVILDGNGSRVIMNAGGIVTIEGVTITGGSASAGGGIYSYATTGTDLLTIRDSHVVDNTAVSYGGGIYTDGGGLKIINSEVSDNTVTGTSGRGAGVYNWRADDSWIVQIINSTVSGNHATGASGQGGGMFFDIDSSLTGGVKIINSTVSNNTASSGAGFYTNNITGHVELHNSIVADNFTTTAHTTASNIGGLNVKSTSSYNLIGANGYGGLSATDGNVLLSTSQTAKLKALDFYGGSTRTHALLYDSPALDAGDDAWTTALDLEFDQRGRTRIIDRDGNLAADNIDIGAFEVALEETYT